MIMICDKPFLHVGLIVGSLVLTSTPNCVAQDVLIEIRGAPRDIISQRIEAQAALIEAQGHRERDFAEARKAYADAASRLIAATSAGIDLDMKAFDAYWDKKRKRNLIEWNRLEERIENARKPMVLENARKVAVWERTIEGELNKMRPGIRSGDLLNRVASQIDLKSGLSSSESVSASIAANLAKIDDRSLKALNLVVSSINGPVDVSLASPLPEILSRWPYLFRDPSLSSHSYAINNIASRLFQSNVSNVEKFQIEGQFKEALKSATNAFYRMYPPDAKRLTVIESRRIFAAEQFLQELERTISNFAEIDSSYAVQRPSYFDIYPSDMRNAATLIQYMMRYGVEFGKARAGTEQVYDRLFLQFRDLATQLNSAPTRDSITEPIINLDLDALLSDEADR